MARFFKHVGEHNSKKVVIVQRAIPEEGHMCSVIYTQIIPSHYHDDIMRVLESPEGQDSNEFWEVLQRRSATTGGNLLQAIAVEGYLKKAPTNQVIIKPNANSSLRLDELNRLLIEAGTGEQAIQRLEELDRQRGFADTRKTRAPMPEYGNTVSDNLASGQALSDADLAQINIKQATEMKAQAELLLAEAAKLENEAASLDPSLAKTKGRKTSATRTKKATA
jgi:hypothetical protein